MMIIWNVLLYNEKNILSSFRPCGCSIHLVLKGIVQPKKKILLLFTLSCCFNPISVTFLRRTQVEKFSRMFKLLIPIQSLVPIHLIWKHGLDFLLNFFMLNEYGSDGFETTWGWVKDIVWTIPFKLLKLVELFVSEMRWASEARPASLTDDTSTGAQNVITNLSNCAACESSLECH